MVRQSIAHKFWGLAKLIIPGFVGFVLAYITFSKQFDANEKGRLNDSLNKLLDVNLQYPFVEDNSFIARWNKNRGSNSDSSLRYQAYCEYVFNFLQNTCEYFNYDKRKIADFVDINDLLAQHKDWWLMPEQKDSQSYPEKFKLLVNQYIK